MQAVLPLPGAGLPGSHLPGAAATPCWLAHILRCSPCAAAGCPASTGRRQHPLLHGGRLAGTLPGGQAPVGPRAGHGDQDSWAGHGGEAHWHLCPEVLSSEKAAALLQDGTTLGVEAPLLFVQEALLSCDHVSAAVLHRAEHVGPWAC